MGLVSLQYRLQKYVGPHGVVRDRQFVCRHILATVHLRGLALYRCITPASEHQHALFRSCPVPMHVEELYLRAVSKPLWQLQCYMAINDEASLFIETPRCIC